MKTGTAMLNIFLVCVLAALIGVTLHLSCNPSFGVFIPPLGRYLLRDMMTVPVQNYLKQRLHTEARHVDHFLLIPAGNDLESLLCRIAESVNLQIVRLYHILSLHLDSLQVVQHQLKPWILSPQTIYAAILCLEDGEVVFEPTQIQYVHAGDLLVFCNDGQTQVKYFDMCALCFEFRMFPFRRTLKVLKREKEIYQHRWKAEARPEQRVRVL